MTTGLPKPDARNFGDKMREFALIALGLTNNRLDAFIKVRDLQDAGIAVVRKGYLQNGGGNPIDGPNPGFIQPAYVVDLTPPPAPGGFSASAGTVNILFETSPPTYAQGNGHAKTRIYAANYSGSGPLPTFADAVEYTSFVGDIFAAPFDPASNLRLWATWETADGVEGPPAGGINGIAATTDLVDDAKIANLSAGKIKAGAISAGEYIQSADYVAGVQGWRIATLVGGDGFFEMRGNAVFGGTIFSYAGVLGGFTIGTSYIRSSSYVLGASGLSLGADGTGQIGGLQIATTYIQSQNYVAGVSGFRLTYNGDLLGPGFSISGGTATFSGTLSAATGTFAGALSAATGTFAGSLSAATGTFSGTLTAAAVNAVDSINIAGNAVTIPVSTSASSSFNMDAGGENTMATLPTFTSKGGQVIINFGGATVAGSDATGNVRVRRNGTEVFLAQIMVPAGFLVLPPVADVPGNGVSTTYTVTWELVNAGTSGAGFMNTRTATALETVK
jgi:hypothetical protein